VDQGVEIFTDTRGLNESKDETIRQAVVFDGRDIQSGLYRYVLRLTSHYPQSSISSVQAGNILVNNQRNSPLGAGWGLAGIERLKTGPDGRALVLDGDGRALVFTPTMILEKTLTISGRVNIFGAGKTAPVVPGGTSGILPPGFDFPVIPNQVLSFKSVTGAVECCGGQRGFNGPDGGFNFAPTDIFSFDGISGMLHPRTLFLAGVFLDNTTPQDPAPPRLNFHGNENFTELSPQLRQTFFIGDGLTTAGEVQKFKVPAVASRLFLGFLDAAGFKGSPGAYDDNLGELVASFEIAQPAGILRTFRSPPGDFSSLIKNPDATFTRTLKDGTQIHFDTQGRHISTIDRNGNTTLYAYDSEGRLISITDPKGGVTTFTYAGAYVAAITDPVGRTTALEHDSDGNLLRVTDPDGTSRQFGYDARNRLISQTTKRQHTTTYEYDFAGRPAKTNLPDGTTRRITPVETVGVVDIAKGLGTRENPAALVRPAQAVAVFTDGNGHETRLETDRFGRVTKITDTLGRTTTILRDKDSNPIQVTRPNGSVTSMSYDERGNLLNVTDESISVTTFFTYEPRFNQVTSIKDAQGNTTTITYDAQGNLVEITDAGGTKTTLAYTEPACPGELTSVTAAPGLPEAATTAFEYDITTCNSVRVVDPLGQATMLSYDTAGNATGTTDAEGRATTFAYDPLNRLTRVLDALGQETFYGYDAGGNLQEVRDAKAGTTRFAYDSLNRLLETTDPLGKKEGFRYDGNGNLIQTIDRRLQTIDFEYDAVNQLVRKTHVTTSHVTSYDYDEVDNLTSVIDPDSHLTFTYDGASRLTSASTADSPNQPFDSAQGQPPVKITYGYDKNGNRLTMNDSVVGTTNYGYDSLNRLTSLTAPLGTVITFTYDPLSRRKTMSYPNGVATAYSYDAASQLLDLVHKAGATTLASFGYDYDRAGNRTALNTQRSGVVVAPALNYVYDALYRLT